MSDAFQMLMRSHDGPVAPAARAAVRWGPGAWRRLRRGADAALLEARLRGCVAVLARMRRSRSLGAEAWDAAERLVGRVAGYRRAAVSLAAR